MQTDYEALKDAVDAYLQEIGVTFIVVNAGVRTVRPETPKVSEPHYGVATKPYQQDVWRASFIVVKSTPMISRYEHSFNSDFFTGIGLRKKPMSPLGKPYRPGTLPYVEWMKGAKPVAPRAADVLYCLIRDADADSMSFHNWCGDYGYDSDSIKALATYQACCETAHNLRNIFNREQLTKLQQLTEDL